MQKAHLYEAILLVNRGVDEAVRGLERLKRAKDSQLDSSCFDEELVVFGRSPLARLNSYFWQRPPAVGVAGFRPVRYAPPRIREERLGRSAGLSRRAACGRSPARRGKTTQSAVLHGERATRMGTAVSKTARRCIPQSEVGGQAMSKKKAALTHG